MFCFLVKRAKRYALETKMFYREPYRTQTLPEHCHTKSVPYLDSLKKYEAIPKMQIFPFLLSISFVVPSLVRYRSPKLTIKLLTVFFLELWNGKIQGFELENKI